MPFTSLSEEANFYLEMLTTPASANFGLVSPEEFGDQIAGTKALPENLRKALVSETSAAHIQEIVLRKYHLSLEHAQVCARILGRVLRGEESPADFQKLLTQQLQAPPQTVAAISRELAGAFITPNYFQIAQVYEKRQKAVGSRHEAVGTIPAMPTEMPTAPPKPTIPPRVVDLRNGPVPSRLPPLPPVAPPGAKEGPPREAPPVTPTPPPPAPRSPEGEAGSPRPPLPTVPPQIPEGGVGSPPPVAPRAPTPPSPPQLPSAPPKPPAPPPSDVAQGKPTPPPLDTARGEPPDTARDKPSAGPSADDLIEKLNQRRSEPPPPLTLRPPGGGEHGPLPPRPNA